MKLALATLAKRGWWPFLIAGSVAILILILWKVPEWHVEQVIGPAGRRHPDFPRLADEYRKTLAQILGGVFLLYGLYLTWRRTRATEEGQITERFTRAIDQLGAVNEKGEKKLEIRLGGIYALERIARDSRKDHWQVMEILTAYVRENARWEENPSRDREGAVLTPASATGSQPEAGATEAAQPTKPTTDIQAILTILGRRKWEYDREDQSLNLAGVDIRGANLWGAHLDGASLQEAHLDGAFLQKAHLEGAFLLRAHLERAILGGAHLEGAFLVRAHLEGADLSGAHLEGAFLFEAHLERADLTDATGLREGQIHSAHIDARTILPDYLKPKKEEPESEPRPRGSGG